MWYGDPVIATAELSAPQSLRVEMWPPQARTGLSTFAVNVIVILADLSPPKPEPFAYEYALTPVITPPNKVNTPGSWVTPAPATWGSAGIGNVVKPDREHPTTTA